jgi:uncharacterized protein (DUF1800 family)
MSARHIALNRFGLGARAGEAGPGDPRAWLLGQVAGPPPALAGTSPSLGELTRVYREQVAAVRAKDQAKLMAAGRRVGELVNQEVTTLLGTRAASDRPFVERWVAFWSNHLCVSSAAGLRVAALAGHYERAAIRPNVLGRFEALLLASARHPAMLAYLNQAQSVGPNSLAARRVRRGDRGPLGLNENYARELLELHTLGVDGVYKQEDVIQLARILTGWSVAGLGGPLDRGADAIDFRFLAPLHEPGAKQVLGVRYAEGGEREGVAVIRALARHPATARHLAGKLVRHFISDDPAPADVERIAAVWRDTQGDLRRVAAALVELDSAWDPEAMKFRTPQDWLVAMFRALGATEIPPTVGRVLRQLNHQLWGPAAPKGYGDLTREWADSDALMNRAELARSIADRLTRDRRSRGIDPRVLASVVSLSPGDPLPGLLADDTIPVAERVALAFAGPAFQWR